MGIEFEDQSPTGFGLGRAALRAGIETWARERLLPRLVPLTPRALADTTPAGRLAVLVLLDRALAGERRRCRARHWSYRLDRHIALLQALAAERRAYVAATGRPVPTLRPPPVAAPAA